MEGNAAAWPQGPHVSDVAPDTKLFPYFPEILSALDPFGGPVVPANTPAYPFGVALDTRTNQAQDITEYAWVLWRLPVLQIPRVPVLSTSAR